jgi:PDZ domain/Aspartyl protease
MKTFRVLWCFALGSALVAFAGFASSTFQGAAREANGPAAEPAASSRLLQEALKPDQKVHRVPYRMSETLHLIVRAKLNGKGPFNFIVDTGAPAMFVTTATAKQAEAEKDPEGWSVFERMELEGGAVITNAKARAEDIFQIRGMNSLNLPGVRLDGVLGYNILARYRMEFDLAKSTMTWTELDFDPPLPEPLRGEGPGGAPPELEMMGNLVQGMGALLRRPDPPPVEPRGFLGLELMEQDRSVLIQSVLPKSPADVAGLRPGDKVVKFADTPVREAAELLAAAALIGPNEEVRIQVQRGDKVIELTATTGRGF